MAEYLVPSNIFEIYPQIVNAGLGANDILNYEYPGAIFPAFKYMDRYSLTIIFKLTRDTQDTFKLIVNNEVFDPNKPQLALKDYDMDQDTIDKLFISQEDIESMSANSISNDFQATKDLEDTLKDPENYSEPEEDNCEGPASQGIDPGDNSPIVVTEIKDEAGNVLESIQTSLAENEPPSCDSALNKMKVTILDTIPLLENESDIPDVRLPDCILPPNTRVSNTAKAAKSMRDLGFETINADSDKIKSSTETLVDNLLNNYSDIAGSEITLDYEEETSVTITENNEYSFPTYGIPIITINPDLNIIIQILDGELQFFNLEKAFINDDGTIPSDNIKTSLKIDIVENPGARILPDIKYIMRYTRDYSSHKLELMRELEDTIYTDEIEANVDTGLFYLGMDKAGLKHFCGVFYKVQLDEYDTRDLSNYISQKRTFPAINGALGFYDFYNKNPGTSDTRIINNRVFPFMSDLNSITLNNGVIDYTLLPRGSNNYTFLRNGVIDDIFCMNNRLDESFTIEFWTKKIPDEETLECITSDDPRIDFNRQVLVSDSLNNYSLYYNKDDQKIVFDFFGDNQLELDFLMLDNHWYFISIKFSALTLDYSMTILTKIYDPVNKKYNTDTISIKDRLNLSSMNDSLRGYKFTLTSFYGEYSKELQSYKNLFNCVSGPIILYDRLTADVVSTANFETQWLVIKNDYLTVGE